VKRNFSIISLPTAFNLVEQNVSLFFFLISSLTVFDTEMVNLSYNHFSGSLGDFMGNLTHMKELVLNNNALSNEIPETLGQLTNLQNLFLNDNSLTGPVPESFGGLNNLGRCRRESLDGSGRWCRRRRLVLTHSSSYALHYSNLSILPTIAGLRLHRNNLEGNVPREVCLLRKNSNLHSLSSDCQRGNIQCVCCTRCF